MKNRMISILLSLAICLCAPLNVYAIEGASGRTNDFTTDETGNNESIPEDDKAKEKAVEADENEFETGTQQNVFDNKENVDADIEAEVEAIIPEEIESVIIGSAEEFINFSRKCRLDTWSANKNVILEKDILLAGTDFITVPYFAGTFNGNGHTISGYLVNGDESNVGLFSYVAKGALIEDLNLVANVTPSGKSSVVAGICGRNNGVIRNCSFKGMVSGSDYIGAIAAINELNGVISDCVSEGYISGEHFTGGIVGENMGNIIRCTNNAGVNTEEKTVTKSIQDIDIDYYRSLFDLNSSYDSDTEKDSMANGIVDTGGIAGLSIGVILHCINNGDIGYERVGYNVGGITGRQSGYLEDCTNRATILGRKDVGGISGQAEPYVTIDFSQDIVAQLSDNISKLHDIIAVTLQDADKQSDAISNRLSIIQSFTNSALNDTGYLADNTVTFVDGVVGEANKVASRAEYLMDEMSKSDGALDQMSYAADNMANMGNELINMIEDFDVTSYLSAEEKKRLESELGASKEAMNLYSTYMEEATNAFTEYYRDKLRASYDYWDRGYTDPTTGLTYTEQNMFPVVDGVSNPGWPKYEAERDFWSDEQIYDEYKGVSGWNHLLGSQIVSAYPDEKNTPQGMLDNRLESELSSVYGTLIATKAKEIANAKFEEVFGQSPQDFFSVTLLDASDLIYSAALKMGDQIPEDANRTLAAIRSLSGNLKSAFSQSKDAIRTISDMEDIRLPQLGEEYRAHCASLNNNLQGMSDNFGYLNSEMNSNNDVMIGDLSAVNDQFNVIMELYADAIDGVLDKDYSTVIQDDSRSVAEECKDATIADCINYGDVDASINVSGIVGTMAIEYDYDLESDVTGIKDANFNTTYLTKCVLRQNTNRGRVYGKKDYIGGVCGLQEMGIILRCNNYSKIISDSGDYVGGIAGSSLSDILASNEKSLLSGRNYVGGIAGKGYNISDCLAVPNIIEASGFRGAIAGKIEGDGVVRNNYFVNDELAGIDRVSYSKKAEPITYDEIFARDNVPAEFKNVVIVYTLKDTDENGESTERTISSKQYSYGARVNADDFPLVPFKPGYYYKWDREDVDSLVTDMEIYAEYDRLITTLAGGNILANGQSQILVDGEFTENDCIEDTPVYNTDTQGLDALEQWSITIPDDGKLVHKVRYHLPDEQSDVIGDDFSVYAYENSKWVKVAKGKMGSYTTFELGGSNPVFMIVDEHKEILKPRYFIGGAAAGLFVIIALIILIGRNRRKVRKL